MRQVSSVVQLLIFLAVTSVLATTTLPASAAGCHRELEVIVHADPGTGLDAETFISLFGAAFTSGNTGLEIGWPDPDYVLAVSYGTYEESGMPAAWMNVMLGFTGGPVGGPSFKSAIGGPAAWYGDLVGGDGLYGTGVSLETLGPFMETMGAQVSEWIAKYERIPDSATADLPVPCYRAGENDKITIFSPPADVGGLGEIARAFEHRLIVKAEKGNIRNGFEHGEDPRARVFLLSGGRNSENSEFEIDYVAPVSREPDRLTVWSSCDIGHQPGHHPSIAPKHEVILEKEIPICRGYRLEYAHEFTIEHDQATLLYTLAGEVTLHLVEAEYASDTDGIQKGKLKGEAKLPVVMAGSFRDCTVTYTNTMSVFVTGEIRRELGGASSRTVVQVELEENYGTVGSGVIDCPDQEPFVTGGVPTPTITQGNEAKLIFEHVEGDRIERPFEADQVTGNATWIIHVPQR